jgi:hypothetical protein
MDYSAGRCQNQVASPANWAQVMVHSKLEQILQSWSRGSPGVSFLPS